MATSSVKKDIESLLKIRLPTYLKNYSVSGTHKTAANATFPSYDWSLDLKRHSSYETCLTLDITMDIRNCTFTDCTMWVEREKFIELHKECKLRS